MRPANEEGMTTEAIDKQRQEIYEIAQAIAPTWERRRADIEALSAPVRGWMVRELGVKAGDTVLELAAGVGEGAAFSRVRTEEVPVRFDVADTGEYLSVIADTAGPLGLALRGLSAPDRAAVGADVEDALARFATTRGYEIPGVALCAVAG
jgi:hypothetical protein